MTSTELTGQLINQAVMATTIVKVLVDLVKLGWGGDASSRPPGWVPPAAAVGIGQVHAPIIYSYQ